MNYSLEKNKLNNLQEVVTPVSLNFLLRIGEFKGKQVIYPNQQMEYLNQLQLNTLKVNALSSNRIDSINIDDKTFEDLFDEIIDPATDEESEIVRYIKVLNIINNHYETLEVTPDLILQFHRNLFRYKQDQGGKWKPLDNIIEHYSSSGDKNIVFIPVPADKTPAAIQELCLSYNCLINDKELVDLIVIAAFIFDFLCIHPFTVGNGRIARILTQLLLYKQDYQVARYFPLDDLLLENKQKYFFSLSKSSQGWQEGQHNMSSWVEFFLWTVYSGYFKLDRQMFSIRNKKGAKSQQIKMIINNLSKQFKVSEIADKSAGISRPTINKVLQELRDINLIKPISRGRDAVWEKLY